MPALVWRWVCAGCERPEHTDTAVPPQGWAAIDGADWHVACFAAQHAGG